MKNIIQYFVLISIIILVYVGVFVTMWAFDVLAIMIVGVFLLTLSDQPR